MNDLTTWLMEHGGPAVRCRTARDLWLDTDRSVLAADLAGSPRGQALLAQLGACTPTAGPRSWHGAGRECLENVLGRALEAGMDGQTPGFAAGLRAHKGWMMAPDAVDHTPLHTLYYGACSLRAGLYDEDVVAFMRDRLRRIAVCARERSADIYRTGDGLRGIPSRFADTCLQPRFHPYGGETPLPLIHDLYALSAFPAGEEDGALVDSVIDYVLDENFQRLPEGYGTITPADGRRGVYHRCGWSPRLPGFHAGRPDRNEEAVFLLRVELMSRFPRACASPWMARCLAHLDGFRTARGTWKLPAAYLADKPAGYWVLGAYMGLEDRRGPLALEVESTLRMAVLHRRADGAGIIDFHVKYDIIS